MRKAFIILVIVISLVGIYGCSDREVAVDDKLSEIEKKELKEREVVDLGGNVVKIPSAEEINRVVIVSPPITSIQYSVLKDASKIVAVNPLTFKSANSDIVKDVFENLDNINTSFVKGFNVDIEAVLNLKPDIIFYYGQQQKKGLESLEIPMVDFMKQKERNPIIITTEWERLIRKIFDINDSTTINDEWNKIDKNVISRIKELKVNKLKGLMIFNNSGNKITVSGNNTYGDYWIEMSGLINVADNIDGEKEVSIEQIYQWNPDIIYVFRGPSASSYIEGEKDWSRIKAVKDNKVYDVPKGIYSWGAPNADSPLMVQWMAAKNYPNYFSDYNINNIIKEYYKEHYSITLTDEIISSILEPKKERE